MCPNCLQIFKVCRAAKGSYVLFRVIPKYTSNWGVLIGRQISPGHKSQRCLWLGPPAVERRGFSFPAEFPHKLVPQPGVGEAAWRRGRGSGDSRGSGLKVSVAHFSCFCAGFCSCGRNDSPERPWAFGRFYWGGGQSGIGGDCGPP